MRTGLSCLLLILLAACSQEAWIDRLASAEEQGMAVQVAQEVRDGSVDGLARKSEAELTKDIQQGVVKVRPILAQAPGPFTIKTVNVSQVNDGPVVKTFVLQAGSGSNWAIVDVVLRGPPGSLKLAGFHAARVGSDPSKINDFKIGQNGLAGYVWLVLMGTCVLSCLLAIVLIWRRPWLQRRWAWTLGCLLGFVGFSLNWSNGAWAVQPVRVSLLGAGAMKAGPFAPWILTFGVPLVAIIVIVRWLRMGSTLKSI